MVALGGFETLATSCVVIPSRCDPVAQLGVYPPKLECKGEYAGDLRKLPCYYEDEEQIGADQIFPLIKTEYWYTPTIKHHCPRTVVASSLRACSNKVGFDKKMFQRYARWFRSVYIPKFLEGISQEKWHVDLQEWLKKYGESYRDSLKQSCDCNNWSDKIPKKYGGFTKKEMQHTTVPHHLKETPLNETKERQICAPCNAKKMAANAFINILEEAATKYFKAYCGRVNWIEICASLEAEESKLGPHIWGASDGSGFDMTQFPEMNELMNELIMAAVKHPNFSWTEDFDSRLLERVLLDSLTLDVEMDNKQFCYKAVGRASGDGWTTFGNTMLMASYWEFTMYLASIKDYVLKVKGDDVLFAVQLQDLARFKTAVSEVFTNRKDKHEHGLGQICKKIDYGQLTDLDFLSNEFFLTAEGHYRMTRIPSRVIQTLSWTTKLPHGCKAGKDLSHRKQLCFSKGKCLKAWADGLPIFGTLADKMIELGEEGKLADFNEYSDGARVWHQGRNDRGAYLTYLEQRYGLSEAAVVRVEDQIRNVSSLKGYLDLPELECLYNVCKN